MDCQRYCLQLHGYRSVEQLAMVRKEDAEQKMSKMTINSVSLTDFKGTQKATYTFGPGVNVILGPNGSGKTTIADGYMYSMSGKDFSLTTNPVITPNNKPADASETQVTVNGEIDGKAIEIVRSQKTRFSKPDANGVRKVTSVNSYSINSVAMAERDAVKRFAEYGIDMDLFTILAHPEVFVNQAMGDKKSKDKARMTVFSMANPLPDIEIAKKAGTNELAELLENYTITEIGEQQKATRRKILAEYGKNGDILVARISEAQRQIVPVEAGRVESLTAAFEAKKSEMAKAVEAKANLGAELTKLNGEREAVREAFLQAKDRANGVRNSETREALKASLAMSEKVQDAKDKLNDTRYKIAGLESKIESLVNDKRKLEASYASRRDTKFDESSTICPTCHRPYDKKDADAIRSEFEERKANDLKAIEEAITKSEAEIKKYTNNLEKGKKILEKDEATFNALKSERDALHQKAMGAKNANPIENSEVPGYKEAVEKINAIDAKRAEVEDKIAKAPDTNAMADEASHIRYEIEAEKARIARVDEAKARVDELNTKRTEYEQAIARTEMIEAQIALFGRTKNEMLTESINSHFKVVSWKLFDYQKNGEYKECLIPMIGSTPYDSLSGGEKMVAMVDIVTTLQRWFDTYLPVFIDEAGIATSDTLGQIRGLANTQIILLKAEDTKDGEIIVKSLG